MNTAQHQAYTFFYKNYILGNETVGISPIFPMSSPRVPVFTSTSPPFYVLTSPISGPRIPELTFLRPDIASSHVPYLMSQGVPASLVPKQMSSRLYPTFSHSPIKVSGEQNSNIWKKSRLLLVINPILPGLFFSF